VLLSGLAGGGYVRIRCEDTSCPSEQPIGDSRTGHRRHPTRPSGYRRRERRFGIRRFGIDRFFFFLRACRFGMFLIYDWRLGFSHRR
jgi:hypothetical protein